MKRPTPHIPELYAQNRAEFVSKMKPNSLAIFHSTDEYMRSADANMPFYQNPDLYYLTGIDQEQTILILYPDAPVSEWREVLLVKQTSEHIRIWEGYKYTQEQASEISGIQNILWTESYPSTIKMMMNHVENVYINLNEHSRASFDGEYRDLRMFRELKHQFPAHQYHRSAKILAELRTIKKPQEIKLMQHAADITRDSFIHLLKNLKKMKYEYEIEAEITYYFNKNLCTHAYHPIIASGPNANILHYNDNNQPLTAGHLILMDYGANYAGYAADMTRTVPYSGVFSPRQREVYQACLDIFYECKQLMNTQMSLFQYNSEAKRIVEKGLIKLGLLDPQQVANQDPKKPLYLKYFPHGVAHFLGLDVHDVGDHHDILQAGAVLTCEPGIYIADENLGIRLENDIVLTAGGNHLDLLAHCPIEIDEIETLINEG